MTEIYLYLAKRTKKMVRKIASLLVILSFCQASLFAANCGLACLRVHSEAAHTHFAAIHQHHHPASHMHSLLAHESAYSAHAASSCHQRGDAISAPCCISNVKAGMRPVSRVTAFSTAFEAKEAPIAKTVISRPLDLKLFRRLQPAPVLSTLRI